MPQTLVVVGAGPVGCVLALSAAQRGFRVVLVEAETVVDETPRAATAHPSTLAMLGEMGLMDDVIARGLVARYFDFWDRSTRTLIARMDHETLRDLTPYPFVVQIEQHKIVKMVLARLAAFDTVEVHLGATVTGFQQDEKGVVAYAERDGAKLRLAGDYLIGTDGGRSTVRKGLGIEFEGYTWPERFLVLTTLFDFQQVFPGCSYRNYLADPDEWVNLFKVAGNETNGRWRAVFPTEVDETDEQALSDEAVRRRLGRLAVDANPAEQLIHRKLYKVHQRVAASFRQGRAFLAGDAAHVNNPIGGLGLNCGIHDAVELLDTLGAVAGGADDALLDRYEARRRTLNIEFVQQQTVTNKQRLEEKDPEKRKVRFDELAAIAADPERERQFLMRSSLLQSVTKSQTIG
jgi:3-(3-hydroxy-phenyl)propionate hydroxylase